MEYLSSTETAVKWSISRRRVSKLCSDGRIKGAILKGNTWLIPDDAKRPADLRKTSKAKKRGLIKERFRECDSLSNQNENRNN